MSTTEPRRCLDPEWCGPTCINWCHAPETAKQAQQHSTPRVLRRSGPDLDPASVRLIQFMRLDDGSPTHPDPPRLPGDRPHDSIAWNAGCYDILELAEQKPAEHVLAIVYDRVLTKDDASKVEKYCNGTRNGWTPDQLPGLVSWIEGGVDNMKPVEPACKAFCGQSRSLCGKAAHACYPCGCDSAAHCHCSVECRTACVSIAAWARRCSSLNGNGKNLISGGALSGPRELTEHRQAEAAGTADLLPPEDIGGTIQPPATLWKAPDDGDDQTGYSLYGDPTGAVLHDSKVSRLPPLPLDSSRTMAARQPRWPTPKYVKGGRWK